MKIAMIRWSTLGLVVVLFTALGGCVGVVGGYDDGYGYDSAVSVEYGVGFYEPFGYDYGGWRPGYRVGPPRGEHDHLSRHMPSIPTHPRSERSSREGWRHREPSPN